MPGRSYLDVARRRWKVLAGAFVVALIAALAAGPLSSPEYTATTAVRIRPITDNPFASDTAAVATVDVPTEVEVVRSAAVIEAAAEDVGEPDVDIDETLIA